MAYTDKTLVETYPNLRLALASGLGTACVGGAMIAVVTFFLPVSDGMETAMAAAYGALGAAAFWLPMGLLLVVTLILIAAGLTLRVALAMGDASGYAAVVPLFRWLRWFLSYSPPVD